MVPADTGSNLYMYYSDPRWGGFNNHLAMFKNAIHYSKEINAKLVLQADYSLWEYIDMEILLDVTPFTYTNFFAITYRDVLFKNNLYCSNDDCTR